MGEKIVTSNPAAGEHEHVIVRQGTVIFREGDVGHCAYMLLRGRVEVSVTRPGTPLVLAERGAGEIFGEMAIIDDLPRSATVRAVEDCELLLITREQLIRRIEETDPILRLCLGVLLERYRETLKKLQTLDGSARPLHRSSKAAATSAIRSRHDAAIEEIRLEQELRSALNREDFELHYQPIVDLKTGWVAGFESLVRWRHEERGLISPNVFIPTAETSGLIVPLGRWCFRQACGALRRFDDIQAGHAAQMPELFVSVNVSGRDFADGDFVRHIHETVDETGVDPQRVKLEITESMLMHQPEKAVAALKECKLKGLSIAIDDFGTGYSSLAYLHKFPIDTLKIDRSFVLSMHDNEQSMEIVRSIMSLAHQLGLPVVAEGIETTHDAFVLNDLGCDYGQGFLFAKPQAEADVHRQIADWTAEVWAPTAIAAS
jgi:EAL domain-containing protein (putative c-di-GMP-specific phosphodiesterase class I)